MQCQSHIRTYNLGIYICLNSKKISFELLLLLIFFFSPHFSLKCSYAWEINPLAVRILCSDNCCVTVAVIRIGGAFIPHWAIAWKKAKFSAFCLSPFTFHTHSENNLVYKCKAYVHVHEYQSNITLKCNIHPITVNQSSTPSPQTSPEKMPTFVFHW